MPQPPLDAGATLVDLTTRYNRLESVYRLTRRIAAAQTVDEVCSIAIEALLEASPGCRCSLLLFDREGVIRFRAWHGISDGYRKAVEGHCPWKPGENGARPIVLPDVRDDDSMPGFATVFAAERIRSLAFVPLEGRDGVMGKFMIYGEHPGDPIGANMALACNIADHVAIAVERCRLEARLMRENELFMSGPVIAVRWTQDRARPVERISPNVRQFGYEPEDFTDNRIVFSTIVHPDDVERVRAETADYVARGINTFEQRYRVRDAAGNWRLLYDRTLLVRDSKGAVECFDGYLLDVTQQRELEQQLLQAQKMESVGRLAGGVAHDFNNLLTVVLGAAEHAAAQANPGSDLARSIDNISHAASRAAALTSQLLAFARKQVIAPRILDLNDMLHETAGMLHRVIGERIELVIERSPEPAHVRMDAGQMQQILVNLALNARDAMPQGGTLTLSTRSHAGTPTGTVELHVRDTGVGMSSDTLEHLFEPFFTTKEIGKGTGLGLATCYGIVTQAGGHIHVASQPGSGTSFRIELPRVVPEKLATSNGTAGHPAATHRVPATILLAEDEPLVREFTTAALRRGGFEVLAAPDGRTALTLASQHAGAIDVLITDLIMPQMGGHELAEGIRRVRPGVQVLYSTGYDPEMAVGPGSSDPRSLVLVKPFTSSQLIDAVQKLLTRRAAPHR
ncbi:MAG: ATP-binding protein [Candidatus Eisenbacteria bacterium]